MRFHCKNSTCGLNWKGYDYRIIDTVKPSPTITQFTKKNRNSRTKVCENVYGSEFPILSLSASFLDRGFTAIISTRVLQFSSQIKACPAGIFIM